MSAHGLTRAELAARLANEFALPWGKDAAARAIAELLPLQRADEVAAIRVVEGRIRGEAAFVICMLLGAGVALLFSDHLLAALVLSAAAVVQFRRAKDVHRARIMRLQLMGEGADLPYSEHREQFRGEMLPVLLMTDPDLFASPEDSRPTSP